MRSSPPGDASFTHDGDLPMCVEVLRDWPSWCEGAQPLIEGLGLGKVVRIAKPAVNS